VSYLPYPRSWSLEGAREAFALLDFEIFSKKGYFLSFEKEKTNFATFGLP